MSGANADMGANAENDHRAPEVVVELVTPPASATGLPASATALTSGDLVPPAPGNRLRLGPQFFAEAAPTISESQSPVAMNKPEQEGEDAWRRRQYADTAPEVLARALMKCFGDCRLRSTPDANAKAHVVGCPTADAHSFADSFAVDLPISCKGRAGFTRKSWRSVDDYGALSRVVSFNGVAQNVFKILIEELGKNPRQSIKEIVTSIHIKLVAQWREAHVTVSLHLLRFYSFVQFYGQLRRNSSKSIHRRGLKTVTYENLFTHFQDPVVRGLTKTKARYMANISCHQISSYASLVSVDIG